MSVHPLQKLIQIFIKEEYPFILNNYPLSVEYDGIELQMDLNLVVSKEFIEKNLTGLCDFEGVDFCRNFFMDLEQFQYCSQININKEKIRKIVAQSYTLSTGNTPHLYRINVNFISNC
jgi:hypothetical protein